MMKFIYRKTVVIFVKSFKIPSYGFQHAIDSEYHCVCHHFKMYKILNLSTKLLIYGKYSEQVFRDMVTQKKR